MFFEKRFVIVFLVLFSSFQGMSQGVVSFPELNVLYKAYENVLVLGAGKKTKSLVLESKELSISKSNDSCYVVRVNTTSRTAQITIRNKWTHKIIGTWQFRIMNLPSAVLYWGIYPPDSEVSLDQPALRSDYGKDIFWANSEIEISSYEINSPLFETSFRVSKGMITPEVIAALESAKQLNKGNPVDFYVVAQVKGKDRILRRTEAHFMY